MKKLILATLFLGISFAAFSQSKSVDGLYQKYKSNEDFFHLDIGGSFMNFAKGMNIKLDEGKTQALANSMERLKMFKLPVNAQTAKSEFSSLQKSLQREKFDLMMEISEKKNGVLVYTKGDRRISDIVVLISDNSGDFMIIELQGDFDSKTVADAGKSIH
ncbi:DUF4252 domain-containing protein [Aquiflexum sp.]|uniref:DUF4252 domain-containing protein n=1 Tax=Aquiflexum sp. TaxID=1872584 RepID=UPI00359326EE